MNFKDIWGFDFMVLIGLIVSLFFALSLIATVFSKPTSDINLIEVVRELLWKYNIYNKALPKIIVYTVASIFGTAIYYSFKIDDLSYLGFGMFCIIIVVYGTYFLVNKS